MKVKMKTTGAGPLWIASPGQEIDVPDETGIDLIQGGFAFAVGGAFETATAGPRENASMPKSRVKRGK